MLWVNRFLGLRLTMPYAVLAMGLVVAFFWRSSVRAAGLASRRLQVAEALAGR